MCGICGAIGPNPPENLQARVHAMNQAMIHRGPDSEGCFSDQRGAIAMRRLAIIDLQTGDQPIPNEDKALWVVLNGEVYNYIELGEDLKGKGHRFRTLSDTETIVHAYEEYGVDVPLHLEGMFAFAIYDTRDGSLFMARDRFGEKPLFYSQRGNTLVFSSEVRSLLEWPEIPRRIDREALAYYLRMGLVPSPLTLLEGVRELPPGCALLWRSGQPTVRPYYTPDYQPSPELEDEADAVEAVREAVWKAVRRQMRSDVPLGAFLSGGIDSSTVVAMLQANASRPVKTYTLQNEDSAFDESNVASAVARHLGTDHHVIPVKNAGFSPDDIWRIVEHVGMPLIDESAIAAYLLSKAARQEVTVCLTGDGGDEMFGGYRVFPWGITVNRIGKVPAPILNAACGLLTPVASFPSIPGSSLFRKAKRALEAAAQPGLRQFATINSFTLSSEMRELAADAELAKIGCGNLPRVTSLPEGVAAWTTLRRLMYYRLKNNLPQIMLVKGDRMSMAASLELRAPFLDVAVAELSSKLPDRFLLRGGVGKYVLRQVARPLLPDTVFSHPKTGFGIPLHLYRNEAFASFARELLSQRQGPLQLLSPVALNRVLRLGLTRSEDRGDITVERALYQLWALVQLAAWGQRFKVTA
ncbi:MAG: asparagine synthase (glutamine-hydrolyzing) [Chloroflexi bacterium]|nr:asparagine synthase (glutamine-hydrolyzing) [Chloroflexota bacterium]